MKLTYKRIVLSALLIVFRLISIAQSANANYVKTEIFTTPSGNEFSETPKVFFLPAPLQILPELLLTEILNFHSNAFHIKNFIIDFLNRYRIAFQMLYPQETLQMLFLINEILQFLLRNCRIGSRGKMQIKMNAGNPTHSLSPF